MSAIYFRTSSEEVSVRGWERANCGATTDRIGAGLMLAALGEDGIRAIARSGLGGPLDFPGSIDEQRVRTLTSTFMAGHAMFEHNGEPLDGWQLSLNTVIAGGSDTLRLMARIHAQCEIHGWIAAEDRAWFAGIIREGLAAQILRGGSRWESVAELASAPDSDPLVMSYSVTDDFPGPHTNVEPIESAAWYALPEAERWARGVAWLPENAPRIQPEGWATYRFGHSVTAYDIAADLWAAKLASA